MAMSAAATLSPPDEGKVARAVRAAKAAAHRTVGAVNEVTVLYRSRRIVLLLPERAVVARTGPSDPTSLAADTRELAVSRYLLERGAPVVGPVEAMGLEPIVEEGVAVTLWPRVEHRTADYDDAEAVADAAHALHRVHERFADYPAPLPSYFERIEECGRLLRDADALPALAVADRTFLLGVFERSLGQLSGVSTRTAPIHGDAHMGNVFFTAKGPLWTDFETACVGPYEWDIAGTPHFPAFPAYDADLYKILSDLRSLCVAVWCSALAADPDKREAAEHQLSQLRARGGRR
jgi:aminoglycoside phosphotransferase (APT) family kinase protein